jgi:hypothetical protein
MASQTQIAAWVTKKNEYLTRQSLGTTDRSKQWNGFRAETYRLRSEDPWLQKHMAREVKYKYVKVDRRLEEIMNVIRTPAMSSWKLVDMVTKILTNNDVNQPKILVNVGLSRNEDRAREMVKMWNYFTALLIFPQPPEFLVDFLVKDIFKRYSQMWEDIYLDFEF